MGGFQQQKHTQKLLWRSDIEALMFGDLLALGSQGMDVFFSARDLPKKLLVQRFWSDSRTAAREHFWNVIATKPGQRKLAEIPRTVPTLKDNSVCSLCGQEIVSQHFGGLGKKCIAKSNVLIMT